MHERESKRDGIHHQDQTEDPDGRIDRESPDWLPWWPSLIVMGMILLIAVAFLLGIFLAVCAIW